MIARTVSKVLNLSPLPKARRRVLVVDDHLDAVHSMAVLLKSMGHDVDFAINGFAAIDAARKFRPEVILLDINLPDFKGDKLANQLKFEPGMENVRIIAVTGLPVNEVRDVALAAGCEAVYAKPMSPSLIEEVLAKP